MSDAVLLAVIGVVSSLATGTIVVAVGVWADGRKKRAEATVSHDGKNFDELAKVRAEYLARIERLEERLDERDSDIRRLEKELADARVMVAQQAARIADLEADLAELHRERSGS